MRKKVCNKINTQIMKPHLKKDSQLHPCHRILTKMGFNTVPQPPFGPDLAPCNFWLFPKLRGGRFETIEEMKEAMTKVIDTLTQEDFHGTFQKLLER